MIRIVNDNILNAKEEMIIDCRNCQGKMGSGVAGAIAKAYPEVYESYKEYCRNYKGQLLGAVHICKTIDESKIFIGLFGQDNYGYDKKLYLDYDALFSSLEKVFLIMTERNVCREFAIPYGIGCGRAGGNWTTVYNKIVFLANKYNATVVLYKYDGDNKKYLCK